MFEDFVVPMPYLADRSAVDDTAMLIATFGDEAGMEAALRAERSRDIGNALRFCHWRQIERLIVLLENDRPRGSRLH